MQVGREINTKNEKYFMSGVHRNTTLKVFRRYSLIRGMLGMIGFLTWFALTAQGFNGYPDSKLIYLAFTFTYTLLLLSGVFQNRSPGYLFLTLFMWLGFWLKATVHFVFDYPYGEPIGDFAEVMGAWDEVLIISIVAGFSVMITGVFYSVFSKPISMLNYRRGLSVLIGYQKIRKSLWIFVVFLVVGINFLNIKLGILRIGIAPTVNLIWPFNSVISWLLGYGMVMAIATLVWWDILLKKEISTQIYVIFFEAIFSSISMLSRSIFLFHSIPQIFSIYKIRKYRTDILKSVRINFYIFSVLIIVAFALAFLYVSVARDAEYSGVSSDVNTGGDVLVYGATTLAPLILDRWVGLEGVMAVSSYHNKGIDLFMEMLGEVRYIGIPTKYQEISNAGYQFMKADQEFATLPGAVAFFYFGDSLWLVWMGMMILVGFIFLGERLAFIFTSNPILVSWVGFTSANTVAQFGITPMQTIIPYLLIFSGFIFIHFLGKKLSHL